MSDAQAVAEVFEHCPNTRLVADGEVVTCSGCGEVYHYSPAGASLARNMIATIGIIP